MSYRSDDDYDLKITGTTTPEGLTPENAPILATRETDGPPPLSEAEQAAVLDLISYMPHLDAIDFDNIMEFLKLLYIADVDDRNYLKFCQGVKERFIEPLLPSLPPRYQHRERRIEQLDAIMREFTNIPFEAYKAAYQRGALPHN